MFESIRCSECDMPFNKSIYEEDLRCGSCVTKKYSDVFHFSINLDDRFREILLMSILVGFLSLMGQSTASAMPSTTIPDAVAYECLAGESADQGVVGMMAVGEVLRLRGSTRGFYGCKTGLYSKSPEYVKKQVREAWVKSETSNLTKGAWFFENTRVFGEPYWAKDAIPTVRIKDHLFYRRK